MKGPHNLYLNENTWTGIGKLLAETDISISEFTDRILKAVLSYYSDPEYPDDWRGLLTQLHNVLAAPRVGYWNRKDAELLEEITGIVRK